MEFDTIAIITLIPALVTGFLAIFTWSHRFGHRARLFSLSMLGACLWSVTEAMIQASNTVAVGEIWLAIQYLAVPTVPVWWLLVIMRYTGKGKYITHDNVALMLVIPLLSFILVATNSWHHLMYSNITLDTSGVFNQLVLTRGPFFWFNIAYTYIIVALAIGLTLQRMLHPQSVYRAQAATLLIALLVTIVTNIFYLAYYFPVDNIDPLPFAFGVSGLIIMLGIIRFRALGLVPIARELVLENMVEAVMVTDREGRLIDYNRRAEDFFRFKPKLGQHVQQIWKLSSDLQTLLNNASPVSDSLIIQEDGAERYYQVSVVGVSNKSEGVNGNIIIFHDVTRLKQVEQDLLKTLEAEKVLRRTVEQEIKKREEFSRTLVHELKTPLTPMLASSDLLAASIREEPWASMALNISRGAENLSLRIDELMDFAKGELGTLRLYLKSVSVADVLVQLVSEMYPIAASHEQYLVLETPGDLPVVMADESRLRQIVQNLITNAFKFSEKNGTVSVRARWETSDIIVEVQDNGIGLTNEEQVKLFRPYERLDAEQRRLGGMGLGLALCKNLVELHGGRIWVESCKGEGSTFAFTLPVRD